MTRTYFVVTGILMHKDKMLILKKSPDDHNYPDHWSFCSGFVKEFEAAEDTVLREIKEETGILAAIERPGKLIKVKDKQKHWVIQTFLCSCKDTKVTLDHENTDYRWITKNELSDFNFVPGLIPDLKAVGLL